MYASQKISINIPSSVAISTNYGKSQRVSLRQRCGNFKVSRHVRSCQAASCLDVVMDVVRHDFGMVIGMVIYDITWYNLVCLMMFDVPGCAWYLLNFLFLKTGTGSFVVYLWHRKSDIFWNKKLRWRKQLPRFGTVFPPCHGFHHGFHTHFPRAELCLLLIGSFVFITTCI